MNHDLINILSEDQSGEVVFHGCAEAYLFSREVKESLEGVLTNNYIKDDKDGIAGFVAASAGRRCWWDTMWTRDVGAFLREMVQWGLINHACLTAKTLITLVSKNEKGYFTFPEYFKYGERGTGSELDGSAAIVIGLILLYRRLENSNTTKAMILNFLTCRESTVNYFISVLKEKPLLPGSGEFGGGCFIEGEYANSVQNALVRLALYIMADLYYDLGLNEKAEEAKKYGDILTENILKYFKSGDDHWHWCIDLESLKPNYDMLNNPFIKGTCATNGILAMSADYYGLELFPTDNEVLNFSRKSFGSLMEVPFRAEQYKKYGIVSGCDDYVLEMVTGCYGHGYASQCAVLLDDMEMAARTIGYWATHTFHPPKGYIVHRDSDFHFYERYYSPDHIEGVELFEGCGALNLVCVAEPLKLARLMVGVDDSQGGCVKIIPRLPKGWCGYHLKNWMIWTNNGNVVCDVEYLLIDQKEVFRLKVNNGKKIGSLVLKLRQKQMLQHDVSEISVSQEVEV